MALPSPNLDDRDFEQLVREARALIQRRCPEWTDLSVHDPGMILVEVFAHLTETTLYRLNRIPEKVYVALLNLIGVQRWAATPAHTLVRFTLEGAQESPVDIPLGTRITAEGGSSGEPLIFTVAKDARIAAGELAVDVVAYHASYEVGRLVGLGTGRAGQAVRVMDDAITGRSEALPFVIGVETDPSEILDGAPAREFADKAFLLYREVTSFANVEPTDRVFLLDRASGLVTFAPAVGRRAADGSIREDPVAAVPPLEREIRAWYWRGGGADGNVTEGVLSDLMDPLPGGAPVKVTNRTRARGGRSREAVENALLRGPLELRSLDRAVTAGDFETIVRRTSRDIRRAKAMTAAEVWRHARAGTVEVLLVPDLEERDPPQPPSAVTHDALLAEQSEELRARVKEALDARRPLATHVDVKWAPHKRVAVHARVVAHPGEDLIALQRRVTQRLHETINPLPYGEGSGWVFGEPLRLAHVWRIVLAEPGVSYVDNVRFVIDEAPVHTEVVERDPAQPRTWFAADSVSLFRTMNDASSWEVVQRVEGAKIEHVVRHETVQGLLAVGVRDGEQTTIRFSHDAGETFSDSRQVMPRANDLAWTLRGGDPVLLIATDEGLYEVTTERDAVPLQVLVVEGQPDAGFWAVASVTDTRGDVKVAVASTELGGVLLSVRAGRPGTFTNIGLTNKDVRVLAVQRDGPRSFLWAGLAAHGRRDDGEGCHAWELTGEGMAPEGWVHFGEGWTGGSCLSIAFLGEDAETATVVAGTYRGGVLRLNARRRDVAWQSPSLESGLALETADRLFEPIYAVAAGGRTILAGAQRGVYRSRDEGTSFVWTSSLEDADIVHLPPTWLFCSGEHQIDVVSRDDAD